MQFNFKKIEKLSIRGKSLRWSTWARGCIEVVSITSYVVYERPFTACCYLTSNSSNYNIKFSFQTHSIFNQNRGDVVLLLVYSCLGKHQVLYVLKIIKLSFSNFVLRGLPTVNHCSFEDFF